MSNDMYIQMHFRDAPPVDELFCGIARTVARWKPASSAFWHFDIDKEDHNNRVVTLEKDLSQEELCRLADGKRDPAYALFTATSFKCWRFQFGMPEYDSARISFYAYGPDWMKRHRRNSRLNGQAELVLPAGPFTEWVERFDDPHRDEVNKRVAENAEAIIEPLLLELAMKLKPSSMKIYHEDCFAVPLNAHFAYYRDEQAVLDDLRFIEEIWELGLPGNRIGPLKDRLHRDMDNVLYEWRGAERGDRIWEELNTLLPMKAQPTWADVERVLHSGNHDGFTLPEGFAVLDYPYFMNAFVDKFYLDVLKEAASR